MPESGRTADWRGEIPPSPVAIVAPVMLAWLRTVPPLLVLDECRLSSKVTREPNRSSPSFPFPNIKRCFVCGDNSSSAGGEGRAEDPASPEVGALEFFFHGRNLGKEGDEERGGSAAI